ncbi:heat shock protein 70C, partial [Reticulomyxa filosa]
DSGVADPRKDGTVAVFDLGGGTFDISILSLNEGVFEVMATNGDTALGGEDFDNELLKYIGNEFKKENNVDLLHDPLVVQRLKEVAEKAKIELSSAMKTDLSAPFITADATGPKHLDMELTRARFESLVDKYIQRTLAPCEQCLKDAGVSKSDLAEVILVGGMTRMPKVQEVAEKFFGRVPSKSVNPDEVVAMGAAIQGGVLGGKLEGVVLIDVTPLSLGIETLGGLFTRLVDKNTAIPTKRTELFSTAFDNQTQVGIKVYQGEREMAIDNKFLGHFDLIGIPPAPRGHPKIEVSFDLDANGILHVSAKDIASAKDQSMRVQTSGGLSDDDIARMKQDAEQMHAQDLKRKETAEVKNAADTELWQAEVQLQEFKPQVGDELKHEIVQAIAHLRDVRNNEASTPEDYKTARDVLAKSLRKIGERIYGYPQEQQQQQQQQQSTDKQDNQSNKP